MKRDYALWGLEWGRWSRVLESNQVSAAYRAAALPLSYLGMVWVARFERATTRFQGGDSGLTELHADGRGRLLTGCRQFGAQALRRFRRPRGDYAGNTPSWRNFFAPAASTRCGSMPPSMGASPNTSTQPSLLTITTMPSVMSGPKSSAMWRSSAPASCGCPRTRMLVATSPPSTEACALAVASANALFGNSPTVSTADMPSSSAVNLVTT